MKSKHIRRARLWAVAGGLALGLLSTTGGASSPQRVPCAELTTITIEAPRIGLPTTGAVVTEAKLIPARGSGPSAVGEHCLATGNIRPVDLSAPVIRFQVALPKVWNAKVVMLGGGGLNGTVPDVAGNMLNAAPGSKSALARGYAVFASDSGHQGTSTDGSFATNDEAFRNWMGDALKKTRDAALILVEATYGTSPQRAYFLGSSTGGREALTVAGRWPADWNGIVAQYPARDVRAMLLNLSAASRALAAPGAYPNAAERGVLYRAALTSCDALDGVADGVISDVRGCNAVFDPRAASLDGVPVRCPDGADAGDTCLSDAQLSALRRLQAPASTGVSPADDPTRPLGFEVYTSDTGIPGTAPLQAFVSLVALGNAQPAFPVTPAMPLFTQLADQFVRYAVARDAAFDSLSFDPRRPGPYADRLNELSALDTPDTDLSAFAARGGKVLLLHGTADLLISPRGTEAYYRHLRSSLGSDTLNSFLRYYEVPGFGHSVSTTFNPAWDQLTVLEAWVERGVDPAGNLTVLDTAGVPGRTRPLCPYPTWPSYRGTGDVNSAASFRCER